MVGLSFALHGDCSQETPDASTQLVRIVQNTEEILSRRAPAAYRHTRELLFVMESGRVFDAGLR
jgi:hypothetical protein